MPDSAENAGYLSYQGDLDKLDDASRFLYNFRNIPSAQDRVKLWFMTEMFETKLEVDGHSQRADSGRFAMVTFTTSGTGGRQLDGPRQKPRPLRTLATLGKAPPRNRPRIEV